MAVGTSWRTIKRLGVVAVMALASAGVVSAAAVSGPERNARSEDSAGAGPAPGRSDRHEDSADPAMSAVRREAEELAAFQLGTVRFRLHWPLQAAGGAGVLFGHRPASWDCENVCPYRGVHVQGEIGLGGAQLAAGWASLVADTTPSTRWVSSVYSGYAIRGAIMRTGGGSTLTPAWQTFAGIEGTLSATRCSLSLAVYHRISNTPSNDPWLIGAGLGWGF